MASLPARIATAWRTLRGVERKDGLELLAEIFGDMHRSWTGKNVTLRTAIQVSAAFACARVIAEGIAMLPMRVLRHHEDDNSIKPDQKSPIFDLLMHKPNRLQSAFEFKETMGLHLSLVGNAMIWTPTISGRIDELLLLEPRWCRLEYNWPNPPLYKIRTDEGKSFTLKAQEVWHVRGPSWATYLGLEFVQLAREALGLSIAMEETQARMQGQGVQTSGFISVDGTLQKEQQTKLREWIDSEHAGSRNAGRAMILDRAAKWVTQNMSNADAQTLELREMQVEEVCRFMRVMPIMVGVSRNTATYASSEQMFLAHLVHTLGPWVSRIESSANRWLLSDADREKGRHVKFNEKVLHRMTSIDQMTFLQKAVLSGILTRNEARRDIDRNPLDGLDEPLTPVNEVAGDPPTVNDDPVLPEGDPAKVPAPAKKPPKKPKPLP